MIKSIAISLGKKYIIKSVNELLEKNKDNVSKIIQTIQIWLSRLNKIVICLQNILKRVEDNNIEDQEIIDSQNEIEEIIRTWETK